LSAGLCIDSYGLADMPTKVGKEVVSVHIPAETPFMKVDTTCLICSLDI
jgi:hypothetical protein